MYNISRIFIRRKVFKRQHLSTVVNKVEDHIKPWSEIPGPLSLPIVGQMLHFLPGGWLHQRTIELQELLYKHYGPIVRLEGNLGFPPLTFIFDPDAAINLFRKEEPLPVRPGFDSLVYHRNHYYKEHIDDPTGSILDHGEPWKKVRSLASPIMLQPKTIKLYSNTMAEVADDMVKRMRSKRNKQGMLESSLLEELNLWALESVAVVALGARLNCLDPNLPDDSPAKKLVVTMQDFFKTTEKLDFQPSLWKYIATPEFTKGMKVYSEQMRLNEFFINKAVEQLKSKKKANDENKSILERLLEIDRKVAIVMTNDMLLAGIDTTAADEVLGSSTELGYKLSIRVFWQGFLSSSNYYLFCGTSPELESWQCFTPVPRRARKAADPAPGLSLLVSDFPSHSGYESKGTVSSPVLAYWRLAAAMAEFPVGRTLLVKNCMVPHY